MKEEDELIRNALADTTNDHPIAAVLTELNKRHVEVMDKPRQGFVPMDISNSNLKSLQQLQAHGEVFELGRELSSGGASGRLAWRGR
jgi:hypothetical protein